jgi:hypothetical protein
MKKIILGLLISLFLVSNLFAVNWLHYLGKEVKVCTVSECYYGQVELIAEIEICREEEPLTHNCLRSDIYYTMYLRLDNKSLKIIKCETIQRIEELNG